VLTFIPPQVPTLVEAPPEGANWIHEIKHDGYRMQLVIDGTRVWLFSRNGLDWSHRFPQLIRSAAKLYGPAIIDGEVVVQDKQGRSSFADLREGKGSPVFIAFDLPSRKGSTQAVAR
jgi:bifunctional non-homologous end joining protein LigD